MSQPAPHEFHNEQIHASVLHKPSCRIELKVKAGPNLVQSARKNAVKAVGKEVLFPGFRKGKAPDEIVIKKYPDEIEKELRNQLADLAYIQTQSLVKIPPLNNNARIVFDVQKVGEEGAELTFAFETEPVIPSVDPKRFEPKPVERAEVGDVQIDEAIRQMRFFFAAWKKIEDRPIQENDYCVIDLDTIAEETPEEPQRVFNKVRFEVSKERMAEWMQKLILGAKSGDVVEGMSEADEKATEKEKKEFTPKKVRIAILAVEEAALPELDNAFAEKVGARDLEHMRQSVTDMLTRQAEEKVHDVLREQVNDFLIETYPFEMPASLIEAEKEHRQRHVLQNPNFRRDWEQMSPEEKKKFEERVIADSIYAVRLFYLSRQVVREAKIGITHREVQNEAVATLRSQGVQGKISPDQIPKEMFALALSKVMLARAQDYIIDTQKA